MNNYVDSKIREIIAEVCPMVEIDKIIDDSNLVTDLEIDSVRLIHLIVQIETAFNIEFNDDDLLFERIGIFKYLRNAVEQLYCNGEKV